MGRPRKLNDEQLNAVRQRFNEGATGSSVAKEFGISLLTAYNIKNNKRSYGPSADFFRELGNNRPVLDAAGNIVGVAEVVEEGQEA